MRLNNPLTNRLGTLEAHPENSQHHEPNAFLIAKASELLKTLIPTQRIISHSRMGQVGLSLATFVYIVWASIF